MKMSRLISRAMLIAAIVAGSSIAFAASEALAQPIKVAGDETVAVGDWAKILPDMNVDACPSPDDLKRALAEKAYVLHTPLNDIDPNLLHKPPGCVMVDGGSDVHLITALGDFVCVQRHGDSQCLWVQKMAVESKSAYDKDQQETKSIQEKANQVFDQQHPECKDYKTNKNLPSYCY
jgi:hypothetical protein